ncbi:MAG: hypothetical protein HY735_09830 [Verrucomicrobia bacterium]|nr:hypothetical protein [Verrucomicrobiota bacterium]
MDQDWFTGHCCRAALWLWQVCVALQSLPAQTDDCRPTISSVPDQVDRSFAGDAPNILSITVTDAKTPAEKLVVSAMTDNQDLLPNSNIQFAKVDSKNPSVRLFIFRLSSNWTRTGAVNVTLTVTDEEGCSASTNFKAIVLGDSPWISRIPDQTIEIGGSTGPIAFTVNDRDTFSGFLTLEKNSSNKTFVPDENIVIGGNGANRTVAVTSASGQEGSSAITITVRNLRGAAASASFVVATPLPPECLPTISSIANQTTARNKAPLPISFKVDAGCPAASIVSIVAKSSHQTLVPDTNILINGTDVNRSVAITPARNQEGQATITITITTMGGRGGAARSASTSFILTVVGPGPPTLSSFDAQYSYLGDQRARVLPFAIANDDEEGSTLSVFARSSNPKVIPDSNIVLGGTGARRTVSIRPAYELGTTTITITVVDGGGKSAASTFNWSVRASPVQLRNPQRNLKGQFQCYVASSPLGTFVLVFQTSSNLRDWVAIATNSISTNFFQFVDPSIIDSRRFYRAVLLP